MENLVAFWQDRPTFVTGATGLVGYWTVRRLVELGADVTCLVRDWTPKSELIRTGLINEVKTVRGDVRDRDLLERILGEYETDTVIHLAAQTIVTIANRNPISTFETNIGGTWNLLEACRRSPKVRQVVIASSDKAYGSQSILPYTENTPLRGEHPYDVSKSAADLIARTYAVTYGLPVVVTRCGNFYGGGDLNWNRIVPGTIRTLIRGKTPTIRSNGNYVRDYFYVEDGAEAYLMLAGKLADNHGLSGESFNFSYEKGISVLDLVKKIIEMMNFSLEPEVMNETNNEIIEQSLDCSKAKEVLGWKPMFSLGNGMERTIEWYRKFLG